MTFNQFMKQEQVKRPEISGDALIDSAMTDILLLTYFYSRKSTHERAVRGAFSYGF